MLLLVATVKERMELEDENLKNVARVQRLMADNKFDKLYSEFWGIAKQRLTRLGFSTAFLENVKNPAELGMLVSVKSAAAAGSATNSEIRKVLGELNSIFASRHNLPEKVEDSTEMRHFLSDYIRDETGQYFRVEIKKYKDANCKYDGNSITIGFNKGLPIIDVAGGVLHELEHSKESWIRLPKLYPNRRIERADDRYREGRAVFAEMSLVNDKDDALAAYSALEMMRQIAEPNPQFYFDEGKRGDKLTMQFARASEGFRVYYSLVKTVGEENLQNFENACVTAEMIPGIMKDGSLVAINPRSHEIFKVDIEKLAAGETNMTELIPREPIEEEKRGGGGLARLKFWKRLDCFV